MTTWTDLELGGESSSDPIDIDGGAIDGTTIGGTTPAAGTFTTVSATTMLLSGTSLGGSSGSSAVGFTQSGIGASNRRTRTVSDKLQEIEISVSDAKNDDGTAVGADPGTQNDATGIQAALNAGAAEGRAIVTTPPNMDFLIGSTSISVPTGVTFRMGDGSTLLYTGTGNAVKVEPGTPDDAAETYATAQFNRRHVIRVEKTNPAWHDLESNTDTTSIGIKVVNQRYGAHELHAVGFYNNIELIGQDSGYAAGGAHVGNHYRFYSRNSFIHVQETTQGATGYVNSNTYYGLVRNDGDYEATGTRGFNFPTANGNTFIGMNLEGSNIEQILRLGSRFNVGIGLRFDSAIAGMVKILSTGGLTLLIPYLGSIGYTLADVDSGGIFQLIHEDGSHFTNGVAANSALNARLLGASGFFHRFMLSDGKILSESTETGAHKYYTTAGKFHATNNPSGLANPTLNLDINGRSLRFRASSDDAAADGTATQLSWATANNLSLFRATFHMENADRTRPLRMGATVRLWPDATGALRWKSGSPSSDTDGFSGVWHATTNTTAVGNVGTGEDNLMTYSLPASTLSANAMGVRITAYGTTANNSNTKALKLLFGTATLVNQALTVSQAGRWRIVAEVHKTGSNTQEYSFSLIQGGTTTILDTNNGSATETDTNAITIKCTGTVTDGGGGVNNNDIVQEGMLVELLT